MGELPEDTLRFFGGDELRARVFYEKYALRDYEGKVVEKTPPEMWTRVSREVASVERRKEEWAKKFLWLLEDFKFIPGGRIMFGAGNLRKATLLNCYYLPIMEDSIEGIFECCKEMARTYSYGGGVGVDISILRPKGSPVANSAIYSTGSVSFMDLFSKVTGTIGQAGRRGALLISIKVDHPDIFDFIECKNDPTRTHVRYANISVKLTDEFMKAVFNDEEFILKFENDRVKVKKSVKAKDIWKKIVRSAWESAEPGVLFWDTIKRFSPTEYDDRMAVKGVNPCSEETLEDYGCCNLGNINLSAFVKKAFSNDTEIDWRNLEKAIRYAVRFLDDVLDYSAPRHPLPQQKEASLYSRRVGLGFTGLADMLAKLKVKYDTDKALVLVDKLFDRIKNIAYDESANIAREKGTFPGFIREKHVESEFPKGLSEKTLEKIWKYGLRNAALLTVPPVGSGAILAGTTSGIEPIFCISYTRRSESLSKGEFKVYHSLAREYMEIFGVSESRLPEFFVTAHQINPIMRVRIQTTIQKHIDASISSTVNLPKSATEDDIEKVYFEGYKLGCKSITVYREGSREGVLITEDTGKVKPRPRVEVQSGMTWKVKTGCGNLYVTVNEDEKGIFEVFTNMGKAGGCVAAQTEAISRLISLTLRAGIDERDILKQISGIRCPAPAWNPDGKLVYSCADGISHALKKHLKTKGKVVENTVEVPTQAGSGIEFKKLIEGDTSVKTCPECGSVMQPMGGCFVCIDCGYSKCY